VVVVVVVVVVRPRKMIWQSENLPLPVCQQ
jgi:hypothetical protein